MGESGSGGRVGEVEIGRGCRLRVEGKRKLRKRRELQKRSLGSGKRGVGGNRWLVMVRGAGRKGVGSQKLLEREPGGKI